MSWWPRRTLTGSRRRVGADDVQVRLISLKRRRWTGSHGRSSTLERSAARHRRSERGPPTELHSATKPSWTAAHHGVAAGHARRWSDAVRRRSPLCAGAVEAPGSAACPFDIVTMSLGQGSPVSRRWTVSQHRHLDAEPAASSTTPGPCRRPRRPRSSAERCRSRTCPGQLLADSVVPAQRAAARGDEVAVAGQAEERQGWPPSATPSRVSSARPR